MKIENGILKDWTKRPGTYDAADLRRGAAYIRQHGSPKDHFLQGIADSFEHELRRIEAKEKAPKHEA